MTPLAIQDVTVSYQRHPVLWHVSYTAPSSGLIAVIGPNGAGKSTLIKACLGLVPLVSGQISIFGQPADQQRQRIGYIPQRESVDWDFPISALEVVAMGRYSKIGWCRPVSRAHRQKSLEALALVGMENYAKRPIGQLSGGQQQRVFLARALAQEADIYFMDEPFAGVDARTELALLEALKELNRTGKTVICVHHNLETVTQYFDHVLMVNVTVVAAGPARETLTLEAIKRTYGSPAVDVENV